MRYPNLKEEKRLWKKGFKRVTGLDESGRGPLAGPVVAAAVLIKPIRGIRGKFVQIREIKDSKKLSPKKREELYKILIKRCLPGGRRVGWSPTIEWGIGRVSERVIDKINILEATKLAMKKAIKNLEKKLQNQKIQKTSDRGNFVLIDFLILDGKMKLNIPIPQKSIIKADEKVFSCAAASILAKVTRDRIMERYHKKYPRYGFNRHKGYPTRHHFKMLKKFGPCKIHRKSFSPVFQCKNKTL